MFKTSPVSESSRLFLFFIVFAYSCTGPKAAFTFEKKSDLAPSQIKFVNQSKDAEEYLWHFGDGTTSALANPVNRYIHSGRYEVILEAKRKKKISKKKTVLHVFPPLECLAEIQTTSGNMVIKLYNSTHDHRDNFIKLAESGYYDGTLFHRVIKGFMIQAGDPDSKNAEVGQRLGGGGPGYTVKAEISDTIFHIKGALAAARIGDEMNPSKSSSGSQFYIVQGRTVPEQVLDGYAAQKKIKYTSSARDLMMQKGGTPQLDQEYTVFGQVIDGFEIIDSIADVKTDQNDRPVSDVKILKINIIK
ncbi:MAG: peptidylprolyl isomerase [Saprospiraceae bacterium]|jgi:peptidyl-prolyl cis-trans isomerase B (cyclophilin B)|nr:peptidylprolyl isomerase [Saprospiraceae bacterium]